MSMPELTPEQEIEYAIQLGYPLQAPPENVAPDFEHGNSAAYQLYITAGVCIPLMVIFTVFRVLNVTTFKRKTYLIDELVFFTGFVLCVGFIATTIVGVQDGVFGRHAWDVMIASVTQRVVLVSLILQILAPIAVCFVKVSVLILYLRVFGGLKWMRYTCVAGIIFLIAYHLSFAIAFGAMCAPAPGKGVSQVALLVAFVSDTCTQTRVMVLIMGIGATVIDIVLLVLPLPVIWDLKMPTRQKLKTSAMFLIGISACIASIFGLTTRIQFFSINSDKIRIVVPLWATAMAEMAAGVIICCGSGAAAVFHRASGIPLPSWLSTSRLVSGTWRSRGHVVSGEETPHKVPVSSHDSLPRSQGRGGSQASQGGWTDTEFDTYPLHPMEQTSSRAGIVKTVNIDVTR